MKSIITRRTFTKTGMAAAMGMTALRAKRVWGANERVRLGVIGTGNRGRQVMEFFLQQSDCEIAAVCDVSASTMQEANAHLSDHALSSFQGVATVKAFGAEAALERRFAPLNEEALQAQLQQARIRVGIGPVLSLAASFNVFLLLWLGGPMAMEAR